MKDSNKIVFNTAVTYAQLIITTILSFFVTRYVLKALGEEDYGIYMLVGGAVAMLNVLSSSMSNTSMRYMSYSLGTGDKELSLNTFNTTLFIHFLLGIFIVIVLEIGGFILFEYFLNIPEGKMFSAKVVYQFMVVTTYVTILSVPFDAVINAHENLLFLSLVSILEMILKLGLSIYLLISEGNRLLEFGLAMMIIQLISRIIKQIYSSKKYDECRVNLRQKKDMSLMKSILSFTGWEFFASITLVCSNQLKGILMNMFFGVRLNTPEGIAQKVNGQVNMVSVGITKAITPQLMKNEGAGVRSKMLRLTNYGVKYTTYMFALVAVPIAIEAPYLLGVWLDTVPEFTVIFVQLCFVQQLADKFTWQIGNAIRAIGRIKEFQIVTGLMSLLTIIIGYFVYKFGGAPVSIFIVEIIITLLIGLVRLYYGKTIAGINPWEFIKETTLPVLLPMVCAIALSLWFYTFFETGLLRLIVITLTYMFVFSSLFILLGVKREERQFFISLVKQKLGK